MLTKKTRQTFTSITSESIKNPASRLGAVILNQTNTPELQEIKSRGIQNLTEYKRNKQSFSLNRLNHHLFKSYWK